MIDEKKLIEERPEWLNPNRVGKEEYNEGWNACNKYWCNTIKSQPKVGEWIPVSERLPDKNGTYLITVSSYDETASIEYTVVDHCNSDGSFLHFETKKNPKVKSGKVVTAWMPCPEPFKAGDNE